MTRKWHERARRDNPSWPAVPYEAYLALAGATAELVRAEVRGDRIHVIPALEDTLGERRRNQRCTAWKKIAQRVVHARRLRRGR